MKAGRNDPCPCGSGKKYKKCCEGKTHHKTINAAPIEHSSVETSKVRSLFQRSVTAQPIKEAPPKKETEVENTPDS